MRPMSAKTAYGGNNTYRSPTATMGGNRPVSAFTAKGSFSGPPGMAPHTAYGLSARKT